MAFRPPIRIASASTPGGTILGIVYACDGASRAVLSSVLSLIGLKILDGDTFLLSIFLFCAALLSLPITLFAGALIKILSRKYVFTIGAILALISMILFVSGTPLTFMFGNTLRMAGAGWVMMCISLYTMDFIPRRELATAESRKVLFSGIAWIIFPALGTWTWVNVGEDAPFYIATVILVILLGFFWFLRINESSSITPPSPDNINVARNVKSYFSNPHMRVAYLIAVARSSSWVMFFTYGPIYIKEAGIAEEWIGIYMGLIVSVLLFSGQFSRIGQYIGIRRTIMLSFCLAGFSLVILGLLPKPFLGGLLLLLLASIGLDMLDIIGNIPFMRMVTPKIRTEMTTVFSTWREFSFVLTPGLSAVILLFANLTSLFLVLGLVLLASGALTRKMPIRVD